MWLGGVAQLGERWHGMPEVTGSSPVASTKGAASVLPKASRSPMQTLSAREEFGPGFSVTVMPHGADTFPVPQNR